MLVRLPNNLAQLQTAKDSQKLNQIKLNKYHIHFIAKKKLTKAIYHNLINV